MKKVAVIGSGSISEQYLKNMIGFYKNIEVVGCSASHYENAVKRAEQFGIRAMTNEEIFADPTIDIVVILVPTPAHAELIEQALLAGKHVYTEKTITEKSEDAKRLLKLADEKGLYLGAAPDTFLGAAYQSARKAIDDGLIGKPVSFSINVNRSVDVVASLFHFLRMPGGGMAYDYGVYYLTALTALLGPTESLFARVKNKAVDRVNCIPDHPEYGQPFKYENEDQIYAVLNLESGVTGTVSFNGDSNLLDLAFFYIYGEKGVLKLSCANDFGGRVEVIPTDTVALFTGQAEPMKPILLESTSPLTGEMRGIGPAEMADAIEGGRKNRASKEMAYHVLDIIETMMRSSDRDELLPIYSTCAIPELLDEETLSRLC